MRIQFWKDTLDKIFAVSKTNNVFPFLSFPLMYKFRTDFDNFNNINLLALGIDVFLEFYF